MAIFTIYDGADPTIYECAGNNSISIHEGSIVYHDGESVVATIPYSEKLYIVVSDRLPMNVINCDRGFEDA